MPSERSGKVKEAYDWKMLLRRAERPDGVYVPVTSSIYDEEIFLLLWGPTVASLSYVFENSSDKTNIQKTILGFRFVFLYKKNVRFLFTCSSSNMLC